jgi:hypothetical protein
MLVGVGLRLAVGMLVAVRVAVPFGAGVFVAAGVGGAGTHPALPSAAQTSPQAKPLPPSTVKQSVCPLQLQHIGVCARATEAIQHHHCTGQISHSTAPFSVPADRRRSSLRGPGSRHRTHSVSVRRPGLANLAGQFGILRPNTMLSQQRPRRICKSCHKVRAPLAPAKGAVKASPFRILPIWSCASPPRALRDSMEDGCARVIARSRARERRELRQVRKEAAVPTPSLCRGEA